MIRTEYKFSEIPAERRVVNDVVVSLPGDPGEIERIASRLGFLDERCQTLQENYSRTIALCNDLKQGLTKKAFNGEL